MSTAVTGIGIPSSADRVEIRLGRQQLRVFHAGRLVVRTHISTGTGRRFCIRDDCWMATTPTGRFHVLRKIPGWYRSPLGWIFDAMVFAEGIAMHGSRDVPGRPASHGCVRIPMSKAKIVFRTVHVGEPVHVMP